MRELGQKSEEIEALVHDSCSISDPCNPRFFLFDTLPAGGYNEGHHGGAAEYVVSQGRVKPLNVCRPCDENTACRITDVGGGGYREVATKNLLLESGAVSNCTRVGEMNIFQVNDQDDQQGGCTL